jgi:hypothetical protein
MTAVVMTESRDGAVPACQGSGGWDPIAQSEGSKSEQVKQCMNLQHCLHQLHLEPTHRVGSDCIFQRCC